MALVKDAARWLAEPFEPGEAKGIPSAPSKETPGKLAERAFVGAAAGAIATLPMSAAMEVMYRRLAPEERKPLPPSQIVMRGAEALGVDSGKHPVRHTLVTLLGHFGYGAASGVAYNMSMSLAPLPAPLRGVVFGTVLWAASYQGWLPITGVLRPATTHARGRTITMFVSHLVWGAVTDVVERQLATRLQVS